MSVAYDTLVHVDTPTLKGKGLIKGLQAEYPVVGKIYIVQMLENLPREDYPYTAVCVPAGCLTTID